MSDAPLFRTEFRFEPADKEIFLAALFSCGITTIQESELEKEDHGNILLCYFPSPDEAQRVRSQVEEFFASIDYSKPFEFSVEPLEDIDWVNEWKKYVRPFEVSSSLLICPTDEPVTPKTSQHVVRIDPQIAFGTGAHETTRLLLREIDRLVPSGIVTTMLDVGCGSGILSIAAKKLGVETVVGIDNKQRAVDVSIANAQLNAVDCQFSGTPLAELPGTFDLVCANIISSVIIELWNDLLAHVAKGGLLLVSGILVEEEQEFLASVSLPPEAIERDGEWLGLRFQC